MRYVPDLQKAAAVVVTAALLGGWATASSAHDDESHAPACCFLENLGAGCTAKPQEGCVDNLGVPIPGSVCCALPPLAEACVDNSCDTGLPGACAAGTSECGEEGFTCEPVNQPSFELCDGIDNDCDPSTPDGVDSFGYGLPCDGPDGDLCLEGVTECSGGVLACSDTTDDDVETCNGADDDCDGDIDEDDVCDPV